MKKDDELETLINEYIQDIDTEKIIQDRLEEKMERNEFLKETMSNLLLTILGLSFLAQNDLRIKIVIIIGLLSLMSGSSMQDARDLERKIFDKTKVKNRLK